MKTINIPEVLSHIKKFILVPKIKYMGSSFTQKIDKCHCGKKATEVKTKVYFGDDIVNNDETYLECDFEYFCQKHQSMAK